MNMWFTKLIKQFFFWLDKIVYNFIPAIYDLLITIARTSVLTQADIADMADRIYKLLAIFMIFKVTLSLITYVVNPDDFSDKSKGVAKLGSNIIISLSLLILTPYLFSYAYQIQTIILEDNSLATLVFGGEEGDKEKSSFFNKAGDEMAYTTMSAFFSPNLSLENLHECSRLTTKNGNGEIVFNSTCEDALGEILGDDSTNLKNYVAGVEMRNLGLTFRQDLAIAVNGENTEFVMEYKFIFSTAVGVVVILLLLSFCMDVAVRSLKLAFLQLIAPIPILSYVNPKSGKDGMFKKWYEMCFSTYLSLFIRLLAIYFSVYVISKVSALNLVDVIDGSYQTNALVAVFVIIGALMFAKDLPKILESLGIKVDGKGFNLNPLRKIEKEALGGKLLKKPNDMLGKGAKALLKAPLSGASLMGRKLMAGIDSAAAGKGFRNGASGVKSNMAQKWDKFLEKNMPNVSKQKKDRIASEQELSLMHSKWREGERLGNKIGGAGNFSQLNGLSEQPYRTLGFSGEFLQSKMNLDKATEKKKILDQIYSARQMGKSGEQIRGELTKAGIDTSAYKINPSVFESDTVLKSEYEKSIKTVSGLESVHEIMRKSDASQARKEDAIKFRKNNTIDPTSTAYVSMDDSENFESFDQFVQNNFVSYDSGNISDNNLAPATPTVQPGSENSVAFDAENDASESVDRVREEERERARQAYLYELEKYEKIIEEEREKTEEQLETLNRSVANNEKGLEYLEAQRANITDPEVRKRIEQQIEEFEKKIKAEKELIKTIKEESDRRIKNLEETINLRRNGE